MIGLEHYLTVAALLFGIGVLGLVLNRGNAVAMLMSLQVMLLAVCLNFVAFSSALDDLTGQVFVLFLVVVAGAQVAVGLAIFVCFLRARGALAADDTAAVRG